MKNFLEMFEKVTLTKISDDMGGYETSISEGDIFKAGITQATGSIKIIAEQKGLENNYILFFDKDIDFLNLGDIVKRIDKDLYYEIINTPGEVETPKASSLNLKKAILKRYVLPKEVI